MFNKPINQTTGLYKESGFHFRSNIHIAGFLSSLLYIGVGLSHDVFFSLSPGIFIILMTALSFISIILFYFLTELNSNNNKVNGNTKFIFYIVLWAVVFRIIGLCFDPIFEDDFYRYLWDGFQFSEYKTPYGVAPSDFFSDGTIPTSMQSILDEINYPDVATIYGPIFQYSFLLSYKTLPANVFALQLLYSLVDIALILVLSRLCKPQALVLYAWCPLVVKEIAFTAHPDGLAVFLLMVTFLALVRGKALYAVIFLALSFCAKIFAILFVPLVLIRVHPKYWLIFTGLVAGIYAPFLLSSSADIAVLFTFASGWQFNGSVQAILQALLHTTLPNYASQLTSLICALLFIGFYAVYSWSFFKDKSQLIPRGDWVLGVFFLLAPVLNAWYLIWLLPFAAIFPSRWAWVASVSILFSYITGYTTGNPELDLYQQPVWARLVEYGAVMIALCFDRKALSRVRPRLNQSSDLLNEGEMKN